MNIHVNVQYPEKLHNLLKDLSFYQNFIERYKSKSDERYVDVDVQYPERLYELQNELPFLSERIKIEKVEKLVVDLYDRK